MKEQIFTVDASAFTSRKEAHRSMQKVFSEYGYFGCNLDALHDALTSIRTKSVIRIVGLDLAEAHIGDYADAIRNVFTDSAEENPNLTLRFSDFPSETADITKEEGIGMNFSELAKSRYSVRSFKADRVPDDIIGKIIEAGYVAPTACNKQPVRITVIKSDEGLERLRGCTECHFDAPLVIMVGSDKRLCWKRPFDGKLSGDIDASIVATHLMLAAADLGIGSTWVMYFDPEAVKKEFGSDTQPIALLPMGYPSDDAAPSAMHTQYRKYEDMVKFI